MITRGGLCRPSDIVLASASHVWVMWCFIRDNREIKEAFMEMKNQREVFVECCQKKMDELDTTSPLVNAKCTENHPFRPFFRRIVTSVFNCIGKNLAKELNSVIHLEKKRKATILAENGKHSTDSKKIQKLTSGGVSREEKAPEKSPDCGKCKFCLDKPKFGGKNTLRRKCINK